MPVAAIARFPKVWVQKYLPRSLLAGWSLSWSRVEKGWVNQTKMNLDWPAVGHEDDEVTPTTATNQQIGMTRRLRIPEFLPTPCTPLTIKGLGEALEDHVDVFDNRGVFRL